ncbi:MAG: Crp/Fnr family transcriptional regulator [Anaerolineae bacterium]|nr:Crp/Fnr family transcriptional regulator [Anaerolineae bacterium]
MLPNLPLDPYPLLTKAALFRNISRQEMEQVCAAAFPREFPRDQYLFYQDEPATIFYIILQGRVRLIQVTPEGHQIIVAVMGPGDGLGIIVALSNMNYPVSAVVVEDCLLLGWQADVIQDQMLQIPQLALNGMRMVAHHFVDIQDRYRELATERVERRIARAVLRLVRQAGQRVADGILIDMPLSRQDLAQMTGTTLYTVSRVLSDWEQKGLVSSGRERVVLRNSHQLVIIAEDLPEP